MMPCAQATRGTLPAAASKGGSGQRPEGRATRASAAVTAARRHQGESTANPRPGGSMTSAIPQGH
jgi:hypothetical protein